MFIKNIIVNLVLFCSLDIGGVFAYEEITPYKFTDIECKNGIPTYNIPSSSRFAIPRRELGQPDIVYYLSKPLTKSYPIAFFCTASSSKNDIKSIIHFHRYFLQECKEANIGLVTVEQWGMDGNIIDEQEFRRHYTRTQRLIDHVDVIEYLKLHPPVGWNGKFIFIGCSEGGFIVTSLTERYSDKILATILWVGADDYGWGEELWDFIKGLRTGWAWRLKLWDCIPRWMPFALGIPKDRREYETLMNEILANPTADKDFMGMTYLYHADALQYPRPQYEKIKSPLLVVAGALDNTIASSDAFVEKATNVRADITYMRISDMDHDIRKRPEVIQKSFDWLKQYVA